MNFSPTFLFNYLRIDDLLKEKSYYEKDQLVKHVGKNFEKSGYGDLPTISNRLNLTAYDHELNSSVS